MQEDFLHYVWQHQYFDHTDLRTTDGQLITVLKPGYRNADAGPDFLTARLQLDDVEWNGAVEIHLKASDWHRHQHQTDPKYDQVVLHVVFEADQPVQRLDGSIVPALALSSRVAPELLQAYHRLLEQPTVLLPCAAQLPEVPEINRTSMVERALLERVEQKATVVAALHQRLGDDWEATAYHTLAAGFGFQKNSEPLARLAKALPLAVLRRHRHDEVQLEALLFGQAGFLAESEATTDDEHIAKLRQEFEFLRHKYSLHGTALAVHEWNFLRLRPANFPPVRLAQLAAVLHARPALFDALLTAADLPTLMRFFLVPTSEYWRGHYRPGVPGKVPALGKSSVYLLITNVVVPLRVAYARYTGQPDLVESAVTLLTLLPAEHNHLTDDYAALGFQHRSSADSQGLLALHRAYCEPRRCLQCAIGEPDSTTQLGEPVKLALAILLNVALAWLFWRWLQAQVRVPQLGRWLLPMLALKLLAWAATCLRPSSDAFHMQQFSSTMTLQLWEKPAAWLQAMLGNEFHYNKKLFLIYHGYSNTFFTAKILSVLNLASCSSGWLNGLYLSLFCFGACWVLVRTVAAVFPKTPAGAALVGFLVWPMVVYWSAGITKESLLLGSAAGLVTIALQWLYGNKPFSWERVLGFVVLAALQFKMRYFFAALLFAALAGLTVVRVAQQLGTARQRWLIVVLFAATIGLGTWAASEVSLVFRLNRITIQLLRNYVQLSNESEGRPRIVFQEFRPTTESALRNAPQAAWEALSRPWFWEGGMLYKAAGLENLLLLAVLGVAVVATVRGRAGNLPFALVLALLFYCLALAVLLGLSTPNLGTLNRYRAALLPFVLWLALQNDYAARGIRRLGL